MTAQELQQRNRGAVLDEFLEEEQEEVDLSKVFGKYKSAKS
jgi:hypothetical protein